MTRRFIVTFAGLVLLLAPADARAAKPLPYRVMADIVAGEICIPQMVFAPGETIVWRAEVEDPAGVPLDAAAIKARGVRAVVRLKDGTLVNLRYDVHPGDGKKTAAYWSGSYGLAKSHPTGTLPWTLTVTDAAGGKVVFTPIGQAAGITVLTIAKKGAAAKG